jgi:PAS domain S-box-containing protein
MDNTIFVLAAAAADRRRLAAALGGGGIVTFAEVHAALNAITDRPPAVVLAEEGLLGAESLARLGALSPPPQLVVLAAPDAWAAAVERLGQTAAAFLPRDAGAGALVAAVERCLRLGRLQQRVDALENGLPAKIAAQLTERVNTERFLAVKQIVDKVSHFIGLLAREVEGGVEYFNQTPYFVSLHDRDLRLVATNPIFNRHFGHRLGSRSWELYEGEAGRPETCPVAVSMRSEIVYTTRATARYRSGRKVPMIVHCAPIFNDDGEVDLIVEVATGSKEIEDIKLELQRTRQRYELLFDEVPCHIAVLDRKGRITAVNRRFKEDFGHETGIEFFDLFCFSRKPCCWSPIESSLQDGEPHQAEMFLSARNGRNLNAMVWTAPIKSASGKLLQVLVIFVDVTHLRELEHNLSSLGMMMGSISHGIKGVLTGLDAGLFLIDAGFYRDMPAQIEEGLEISRMMVERIRKVVLNILYYAKKRELTTERVDLLGFVCEVADQMEARIRGADVRLVCQFDPQRVSIAVDTAILRSALFNILENAMEACIEDPSDKPHRIVFSTAQDGDHVTIEIRDNGCGMDPEALKEIFTMFYSTKGNQGTGLGLFITEQVIREHGGSISVKSRPGEGTLFSIRLPKSRRPAGGASPGDLVAPQPEPRPPGPLGD